MFLTYCILLIYLLLFYKPNQGPSGSIHSWIFNHRSTCRSDGLHNLVLRLSVRTYLGLFSEVSYPPIQFMVSITVVFFSLGLFWFTSCIPNTLAFWINIEDPALFLRVPLSIFSVRFFPEEALKLPAKFLSLSIQRNLLRLFSSAWYINHIVSIHSFFRVDIFLCSCMASFPRLLIFLKGPLFSQGSEMLEGNPLHLQAMSW